MTRIFFIAVLTCILGVSMLHGQSNDTSRNQGNASEIQKALEDMERSLDSIEIADIDLQGIIDQVKASLPTKEEMEKHQELVRSALKDVVKEIKRIDFTELEKTLQEIGSLFNDVEMQNQDDPNVKKI